MRTWLLFFIGGFLGFGLGIVVAASQGLTLDGHDHVMDHGGHDGHKGHMDHAPLVLPPGSDAPTLSATVIKDTKSGWNLHLTTTNFTFAPDQVNQSHQPGLGHAHVYVNDEKIARLYGPWLHIPSLPQGNVEVTVELNANTHEPLYVGDTPLRQVITVSVK